jgi:hypothetical protein
MAEPDRRQIAADWPARGFSCDLWTDPPGQRWENFRHAADELVAVLEGHVEFEIAGVATGLGTPHHPDDIASLTRPPSARLLPTFPWQSPWRSITLAICPAGIASPGKRTVQA